MLSPKASVEGRLNHAGNHINRHHDTTESSRLSEESPTACKPQGCRDSKVCQRPYRVATAWDNRVTAFHTIGLLISFLERILEEQAQAQTHVPPLRRISSSPISPAPPKTSTVSTVPASFGISIKIITITHKQSIVSAVPVHLCPFLHLSSTSRQIHIQRRPQRSTLILMPEGDLLARPLQEPHRLARARDRNPRTRRCDLSRRVNVAACCEVCCIRVGRLGADEGRPVSVVGQSLSSFGLGREFGKRLAYQ